MKNPQTKNVKKQPGGAASSLVINTIDVRPFPRRDFDIPGYRSALQSAESRVPSRFYLYDLYSDVELDDQVQAVIGKLIDSVTGANWQFVDKSGKEMEVISPLIDTIGFDRLLTEIVKTKFWGYSMLEPKFFKNAEGEWEMSCYLIPRLNMRPEIGVIAYDAVTDAGINIREGIYTKTIMEVGEVDDLGKYLVAAPYRILKRGSVGDWAMFVQVFGEPIIDAVYDGLDESTRAKLQTALSTRGPGGAIIRPKGTELTILANTFNATGALQDAFVSNCDRAISKGLLGTTETSQSSESSGYAQSKTHEGQDERKQESLLDFVRKVLNSRFKPIMAAAGFEVAGGKFIIEGEDNELTKAQSFDIHLKMALPRDKGGLDIPMSDDFFYDNYGVPKPDNYDELKRQKEEARRQSEPVEDQPDVEGVKGQKPKKPKDPVNLNADNRSLLSRILDFFAQAPLPIAIGGGATGPAPTPGTEALEVLSDSPPSGGQGGVILSTEAAVILSLSKDKQAANEEALLTRIATAKGTLTFDVELYEDTFKNLFTAFKSGLSSPWGGVPSIDGTEGVAGGITLSDSPPSGGLGGSEPVTMSDEAAVILSLSKEGLGGLLTPYELNLFRFSAGKTLAEVQELNAIFRQSKSFAEFEKLATPILEKYNRTWAQTEYTTAQLVGEAAATYRRLVAQSDIFPYWEYRTVGDEHVRKEHAAIHGLILPWDDPRWSRLFPPNGWNCRCFVVPRLAGELPTGYSVQAAQAKADAYFLSYEWRMADAQGWGVNRGQLGQIFTANQQYVSKHPGMASKMLNALQASDFNLPGYSKMKKTAQTNLPPPGDTPENPPLEGVGGGLDYGSRTLTLPPSGQGGPDRLRAAMHQALKDPDEVWLQGTRGSNSLTELVYVKYYKDETIVVYTNLPEAMSPLQGGAGTAGGVGTGGGGVTTWLTLPETDDQIREVRRGILIRKSP